MLTETINYRDGGVTADLTVEAADSTQEFARWRCHSRAQQDTSLTPDLYLLRMYAYSDVMAVTRGTIEMGGETIVIGRLHPLTFDLYRVLPDALIVEIEDALYRCNPQWLVKPVEQQQADQKKAAPTYTAG